MTKKLMVDVEESLGWQENGRLKPADKKEYADKNIKIFYCLRCGNIREIGKKMFGEEIVCEECGSKMIQRI